MVNKVYFRAYWIRVQVHGKIMVLVLVLFSELSVPVQYILYCICTCDTLHSVLKVFEVSFDLSSAFKDFVLFCVFLFRSVSNNVKENLDVQEKHKLF